MKSFLAGFAALALVSGAALAQPAESSTTQTDTATTPDTAPGGMGASSQTRTSHSQDAYGDSKDTKSSSYQGPNGSASSSTSTNTVAAPPPPPTSTTTTTQSTTSESH